MKYYYIVCFIYFIAINFIAFLLFGIDKHKASVGKWRIRERSLFITAALGGSIGALLGMRHFRHKTKHTNFVIGIPAILIAQIILALLILH
ncbi:MAG: DUF1294 domain-containing protein [Lachnospiraceae bacterium]|nr:DUF1294 domain-containing protein [Lachnospiraceae bacterium]